jgi:hypothetical protein
MSTTTPRSATCSMAWPNVGPPTPSTIRSKSPPTFSTMSAAEHQTGDFERPQRRHPGGRQRGGLRVGYRVGNRRQSGGWDRGELRPGTAVGQADYASALSRSAAIGGGAFDHTCRIPARYRPLAQVRQADDLATV